MGRQDLRLRVLLADNVGALVALLLVFAAVGGYATYTAHVAPGTETETRQLSTWEERGEFAHQATVVNGTEVFPAGATLENRSVYFRRIAPRLNGTFAYTYDASESGDLTAETSLSLLIRSVERRDDGNDVVYWRLDRPLAEQQASLSPGDRTRTRFTVDVDDVAERTDTIESQLGSTPGTVEVIVVARVTLSGTRNGQPVETTNVYRLPLSLEGDVYRVDDPGTITDSGAQREQVSVPVEYGPLRSVGGPLLAFFSLAAAVGLLTARRTGRLAVSEYERARLSYRTAREEFDEWITAGQLPSPVTDGPTVTVDSLEGLVDVAIDTDRRVIEDSQRGLYVVVGDSYRYVYRPPRAVDPIERADDNGHEPDAFDPFSEPTETGHEERSADGSE